MPKQRVLSGQEVLQILRAFGFQDFAQRGSHIKVRRVLADGRTQTLTVANHDEIDRGTLHAIIAKRADSSRSLNSALSFYGLRAEVAARVLKSSRLGSQFS